MATWPFLLSPMLAERVITLGGGRGWLWESRRAGNISKTRCGWREQRRWGAGERETGYTGKVKTHSPWEMHSTFSRLNPTCLPVFPVITFVLAAPSYLVEQDGQVFSGLLNSHSNILCALIFPISSSYGSKHFLKTPVLASKAMGNLGISFKPFHVILRPAIPGPSSWY